MTNLMQVFLEVNKHSIIEVYKLKSEKFHWVIIKPYSQRFLELPSFQTTNLEKERITLEF